MPRNTPSPAAPAEATPIALENVPGSLSASSNNSLEIFDNTAVAPVEVVPVEVEEVPLLGTLSQFNYR